MGNKPYITSVNDVQVFSADYVFEMQQAQGCRIDRAKAIAITAVIIAIASVIISVATLLR